MCEKNKKQKNHWQFKIRMIRYNTSLKQTANSKSEQQNGSGDRQWLRRRAEMRTWKRKIKKFLTESCWCDNLNRLTRESTAKKKNIDNWTIDNNPWKFLIREKIQERIGHEEVRQSRTAFTLDSWRTSSSVQCQTTVKREELASMLILNWTQTKKLRQFWVRGRPH